MPDQIESFKVLCDGGLDTSQNHLTLSQNKPGSATRLVNYEVSLFGGYRRIEGFSKYDNLYSEVGSHATMRVDLPREELVHHAAPGNTVPPHLNHCHLCTYFLTYLLTDLVA